MTGSYRALFTRVIYTEWIFFALLALGVVLMRRRPGYAPAWRMPLVPLAPILFMIVSLMIVVNQIRVDVASAAMGLAIVATGIPGILFAGARKRHENRLPQSLLSARVSRRRQEGPDQSPHGLRRGGQSAAALSRRLQHPGARPSRSRLPRRRAEETRRRQAGDHVHHARHALRGAGDRRRDGQAHQRCVRDRGEAAPAFPVARDAAAERSGRIGAPSSSGR